MECKIFRLKRIKAQIRRLLPLLFLLFAFLIMVLIRSDAPSVMAIRSFMWSCFSPVVTVVRQPLYWLKDGVDGFKNWSMAYQENQQLKQENEALKQWRLYALKLETENKELKGHLKYQAPKKVRELTAEIVLNEAGAFSRSFIVRAGKAQGVKKGMLGFGPKAMFGRITYVSDDYSQLMPLTDYMSRVPVFVGEEKKSAFLIGDNSDRPYLQFPKEGDTVKKGELIVTSGYMGVYPSNLAIGGVYDDNPDLPRVALFENINVLSFVRLLDFNMNENLLKQEEKP